MKRTKKVLAGLLATLNVFSGSLGLAACGNQSASSNSTNSSQAQIGGGNSQGGSEEDYSKFSNIFKTVLSNPYYSGLIGTDLSYTSGDYAYNNPKFQPVPYGFLEDEGYDIEKIKNKELETKAELYSINNDLFVELKTEIKATIDYYATYLLRYSLTNQELNELQKLFADLSLNNREITYYQAPFFVQELSYQKEPELISLAYLTKICIDSATDYFNKEKLISNSNHVTYLGSEYVEKDLAYHNFNIRPKTARPQFNSRIGTIKIATIGYKKIDINDITILNIDNFINGGILTGDNKNLFDSSITSIISYTSRNHYFKDVNTKTILENLFSP